MDNEQTEETESTQFELDLTNAHLHDLNEVSIVDTLTDIDLTCNRFINVDPRILNLVGLKNLSFRQNLLSDCSEFALLESKSVLEMLDLRDNQFQEIPSLSGFQMLKVLEISYNQVRSMHPLSVLTSTGLESLYLASNKVPAIDYLYRFTHLKVLELGFNRIRVIENISHLQDLEELWLGRNRITEIKNLNQLTKLQKISLQSNRLQSMSGIGSCQSLEELYLSHNGITKLEELEALSQLKVLDVSNNLLSRVECLDSLTNLEDLWLNDNQIENWEELSEGLKGPKETISTIYFDNNPIANHPHYKTRLKAMLPNLKQLDADVLAP